MTVSKPEEHKEYVALSIDSKMNSKDDNELNQQIEIVLTMQWRIWMMNIKEGLGRCWKHTARRLWQETTP